MSSNLEFYPLDFETKTTITPEELLKRFEDKVKQTFFHHLSDRREALKAQIASKNDSLVVGERMPSPSVSAFLIQKEASRETVTLAQHKELTATVVDLMKHVQQWQTATLEPGDCGDCGS